MHTDIVFRWFLLFRCHWFCRYKAYSNFRLARKKQHFSNPPPLFTTVYSNVVRYPLLFRRHCACYFFIHFRRNRKSLGQVNTILSCSVRDVFLSFQQHACFPGVKRANTVKISACLREIFFVNVFRGLDYHKQAPRRRKNKNIQQNCRAS